MAQQTSTVKEQHTEVRHLVIYGYSKQELAKIMKHFESQLPEYVKIDTETEHLVTRITLTGINSGLELLRFQMNKYQQNLNEIFAQEVVTNNDRSIAQVLGELLSERELTVACAESCTGGGIAHKIVEVPGASTYFIGSIVAYSNEIKARVLGVSRRDLERYGAVSKEVAEAMVKGACKQIHTDCAIATTGIAGPDGGSRFKPIGTVWIAIKCLDKIVSECIHFDGNRNDVIEGATNHGLVMLIKMLRNNYVMQEDFNDE